MVGQPLQFQENGSDPLGASGNLNFRRAFHGLAKSGSVGKTRVPGNTLRQVNGAIHWQLFEAFLDSLVNVEHPQLQIQDRFSGDGKVKVSWLDDAGVNGSHGNL